MRLHGLGLLECEAQGLRGLGFEGLLGVEV